MPAAATVPAGAAILDERIRAELVRLLYRALPRALAIGACAGTILVAALWPLFPSTELLAWLAALLLVSALRLLLAHRYRVRCPAPPDHAPWLRAFVVAALVSGAVWGTAGFLFFAPQDPLRLTLLATIIVGVGTGAVMSMAGSWLAATAFLVPTVLPFFIRLSGLEAAGSAWTAVLVALLLTGMGLMSRRLYEHVHASVRRGLEAEASREALEAQNQRFRTLVDSTRAIFWEGDPETFRFSFVSQEAEGLLGYPTERWIEEPTFWVSHMHPDDADWAPAYCALATAERRQHTFDYRMIAADGRVVWLRDVVSVLVEGDRPSRLVGIMLDVTETRTAASALEYVSGLQRTLVEVSREFLAANTAEGEQPITDALGRVGRYCQVDRVYLFGARDRMQRVDNTHEWCAPGIAPQIEDLQDVPADIAPRMFEALRRGETVHIPRVADLPAAWADDRAMLEAQDIQSVVIVPIRNGDTTEGFVGFDSVRQERDWVDEEIRLLTVLGDLLGAARRRDESEQALRRSEALRAQGEDLAAMGSWEWDVCHDTFHASDGWRRITGCETERLNRERVLALSHPDDRTIIDSGVDRAIDTGEPYELEHRIVRQGDGEVRWVRAQARLVQMDGEPDRLRGFIQDITERHQAEERLAESEARYRSVVDSIDEVVYRTDASHACTFLNVAWTDITGHAVEQTLGTCLLDYIHPDDRERQATKFAELANGRHGQFEGEMRQLTRAGDVRWLRVTARAETDARGRFQGCTGTMRDVTEQREAERKMLHLAHYDTLTDLPNRMLALDRLSEALKAGRRSGRHVGVLFLDLDHFKKINDTLGHETGDAVLAEAARRLVTGVREGDTVARLGGDEFLVLLNDLHDPGDAQGVATHLLDRFREPFRLANRSLVLTASIGIAVSPGDGDSAPDLLRHADTAMYQSKHSGRNAYNYFEESMNRDIERRLAVEEALREALARDELHVVFQPLTRLADGAVVGAEALLRWDNAELGPVSPGEFVPIAEQTGLIHAIGDYVLREALTEAAAWRRDFEPAFRVSVNVSPQQFREPGLVGRIEALLGELGLDGDALEIEITEGVLLSGHEHFGEMLESLRRLGVGLAMDDFGTGYASLSYLRQYPFDTLKIDQSFVRDIERDASDRELVSTALRLAEALGLRTVAEGVETETQRAILREQGCELAQGYLLGVPMPAEAFERLLAARVEPRRNRQGN